MRFPLQVCFSYCVYSFSTKLKAKTYNIIENEILAIFVTYVKYLGHDIALNKKIIHN